MHYHIIRHKNYYLIIKNKDFYKCYIYFNYHIINNYLNKRYKHYSNLRKIKFYMQRIVKIHNIRNSKDNQYNYYHYWHLNCNKFKEDTKEHMKINREINLVLLVYYIWYKLIHWYIYHKSLNMEDKYQLMVKFIPNQIFHQDIMRYKSMHQD